MPLFVVAGMHRSGTSALTGLTGVLGAHIGDPSEHIRTARDNPRGFYELRAFKELNEQVLAHLGGDWRRPPARPEGWQHAPGLAELADQGRQLLDSLPVDDEVVVLKDPRASLTLPFWQELAPVDGVLVGLRHPVEVAASLATRNGITADLAGLLWATYTAGALTAAPDPLVVAYDDLLGDPQAMARRLVEFLGLPTPDESTTAAVEEFLDPDARHHEAGETVPDALRVATELHDLVRAGDLEADLVRWTADLTAAVGAADTSDAEARLQNQLRRMRERAEAAEEQAAAARPQLVAVTSELEQARERLTQLERRHDRLRNRRVVRLALGVARLTQPLFRLVRTVRRRLRPGAAAIDR